jgi:uncharacterized protein
MKTFLATLLLLTGFLCKASAQDKLNIINMEHVMDYDPNLNDAKFEPDTRSAEGMVFSGIFYIYKRFISSQDGSHCTFYPSCSQYGLKTIRKNGFILGMVDAFDRLSRCNTLSPELYHKHPTINRFYDPVE